MVEMAADGAAADVTSMFLNVGLHNGVLQRTRVDALSGNLTDTRTRFLGSRPVKLFRLNVQGRRAVLALSSRAWLSYTLEAHNRHCITPLSYEALEYAANFTSEQCSEGVVAIAGNTLRILTIERLGQLFNQQQIPLRYTPRRMVVHPQTNQLLVIESDHNEFNAEEKEQIKQALGVTEDEPVKEGEDDEEKVRR